jgi:hypothetical protein
MFYEKQLHLISVQQNIFCVDDKKKELNVVKLTGILFFNSVDILQRVKFPFLSALIKCLFAMWNEYYINAFQDVKILKECRLI